jgi:hypothetical protein
MAPRVLVVLVIAGLALSAAPSAAHDQGYDTKITIREVEGDVQYKGRVKSQRHACEAHRGIEFWHRQSGPDALIDEIESNAKGKWEFGFVGEEYYVIAVREVVGGTGHHHVCREDKSPTA